MQALSQLSYSPTEVGREGTGGLPRLSTSEPGPTRGLQDVADDVGDAVSLTISNRAGRARRTAAPARKLMGGGRCC